MSEIKPAQRVRECLLDQLAFKCGLFGGPRLERGAESMRGQVIAIHAPQQREHGHIAERRFWLRPWKDVGAVAQLMHLFEQIDGAVIENHGVLAPALHPLRWNFPDTSRQVDLIPGRANDLAGSRRCQNRKLKRASRNRGRVRNSATNAGNSA